MKWVFVDHPKRTVMIDNKTVAISEKNTYVEDSNLWLNHAEAAIVFLFHGAPP